MSPKDAAFMEIAGVLSTLSTCPRRDVGCVLVDDKFRIIGSGYNGVPRGKQHCKHRPCPFMNGEHGSTCWATHAEVNAIAQCQNTDRVWTVYTTTFPCLECFKLIMNTTAARIVYDQEYPASEDDVRRLNMSRIDLCRFN